MVSGKVKSTTPTSTKQHSSISRSFAAYFPRTSAQVQPRPPDLTQLLRLVEELRENESRLKTEQKLLNESVAIVPVLENEISKRDYEIEKCGKKISCLESENERLREENEFLHVELSKQNYVYEEKIKFMQCELLEIKRAVLERQDDASSTTSSSSSSSTVTNTNNPNKSNFQTNKNITMSFTFTSLKIDEFPVQNKDQERDQERECPFEIQTVGVKSRVPRPPPRPRVLLNMIKTSPLLDNKAPPPPPPPPPNGIKLVCEKVKRVPEVVEFYHSLMRRDSICRQDSVAAAAGGGSGSGSAAKDMIGEIENRSAHLLAIKTDVETQGDFIRYLIKEVEGAAFTDIQDVLPFVKWLDDELSYLVDERAVLKHFDWPEKKADALREAAFGYSDLKKLESEASSFRDDPRQPCGPALKKMQSMFEKLEHGAYNLSRMRESAMNRFKLFKIPMNWMQDTGYINQIKLASVKLAMKYLKRVLAEFEMVAAGTEEELILQGVKFAFRVHQFAGGFDVGTMKAFQELRDKACSIQCQSQHQHKSSS